MSETTFQVSATTLIVAICGALGSALIVLPCAGLVDHPWSTAGLALVALACTVHISCAIRRQGVRARDAFELGRESMRLVRN